MGTAAGTEANLAVFCDFENVALGARDAKYGEFNIQIVLERLLDKGKVVVKKAYSDWARYEQAKRPLHEAAFELIEVPHVSYSGKNSADIRLVVDALDLCYTKEHIDTFVIVSGDSDFSPLVNKLRENNKVVVGVGVKSSTSNLLVENCDDFIYYDDLVRQRRKRSPTAQRSHTKHPRAHVSANKEGGKDDSREEGKDKQEQERELRRVEAIDAVIGVAESLLRDRDGLVWGSMVKQTLKRKRPNFSESFHGYRSFGELLEDAQRRGLLKLQKDERSGGYQIEEVLVE